MRIRLLIEGDVTDAKPVKFASRAAYEELLAKGIEIYEYQPAMMHTKAMIVDGVLSIVGSANFDNRSFELNDELNIAVFDRGACRAADVRDFERDLTAVDEAGAGGVARAAAAHPRPRAGVELFRGAVLRTTERPGACSDAACRSVAFASAGPGRCAAGAAGGSG